MGSLTPYQRLIEFQQLTDSPECASARALREADSDFGLLDRMRRMLTRNWKPIAGLTALGLFLGTGTALLQTSVYRGNTAMEMQIPEESGAEGAAIKAEPYLQTQLRLLESDSLLWTAGVKSGLFDSAEYSGLSRAARLETIHRNLAVKLAGQTRIVEVSFEANDAAASANFANQLVQSYRELLQGRRFAATRQAIALLETRIAERKEKTDAAQNRLRDYVKAHGMSWIERENSAESRRRELQSTLAQAQAARAQEQAVLDQAERFTAESANQAAGVAEADTAYQRERSTLLNRLRARLIAAQRKERLLRDQVARQSAIVAGQATYNAQYHALKLDADQQRAAYDEAVRKFQEVNSSANASVIADQVLVLDTAHQPETPVRPNKAVIVALGLLSGLLAGLIVAFGREARTRKVEAQAKASAAMGVPQLGIAPPAWIDAPKGEPKRLAPAQSRGRYALWNFYNPGSAHAEAYRDIVTSLMFASDRAHDGHLRVVITSANPGEGRTTAAVNLATGIAETGCRVLLVDGNRNRQALHEIFDAPDTTGFFQAIALQDGLTAPVFASDVNNLFVMPAGPFNNAMLDVASLRKVLEDLRQTYDVILIDAPPVLGHADARWFSRVCDGAVLVHDPRITAARDAEAALARLRQDRIHVFGTVLNQWSETLQSPARHAGVIPEIRIRLRITR
jgi:polysaccharide biosynthesis transport protein